MDIQAFYEYKHDLNIMLMFSKERCSNSATSLAITVFTVVRTHGDPGRMRLPSDDDSRDI